MAFYFCDEIDCCEFSHTKGHIISMMKKQGLHQAKVWRAVPIKGNNLFYCSHFGEIGEVGESGCGKECDSYKPRNGKNGRCRHSKDTYEKGAKMLLTF